MFSKNAIGILILVLSMLGINVAESDLIITVATIAQIVSGALLFLNQATRKDVVGFFFKK